MNRSIGFIEHNATLRRWIDMLFLSFILFILYHVFRNPISHLCFLTEQLTSSWSFLFRSCVNVLIIVAITFILIRLGGIHREHSIRSIMKYPPAYLAACIALLGIFLNEIMIPEFPIALIKTTIITIVTVFFGIGIGFILDWLNSLQNTLPKSNDINKQVNPRMRNFWDNDNDLIQWIRKETPVKYPNEDMFGHAIPARRIARLLLNDSPKSIGVVGSYGSGKSCLLNLIEYYLDNRTQIISATNKTEMFYQGKIIRCRIDGWGRGCNIPENILSLAIEKVRCHVDCMSIIRLPEKYRQAISGVSSGSGAILATLLHTSHDPIVQLMKLDDILEAMDLRLIIFLEDIDRNVSDESIRDEIPSLLDRLRILTRVSFVIAIGIERQYSDILVRICDHIEAIA